MKTNLKTLKISILIAVITVIMTFQTGAQSLAEIEAHRVTLPNGWQLTPVGTIIPLGDLPLNIAISPSGKLAAVTNNGQSDQTIQLVNIKRGKITESVTIGKSWLGLTFSANGKYLYASGGNDNIIIRYSVRRKHLTDPDTIRIGKPWPERISIAGIAIDDAGQKLYAVTKENNSLYVIDAATKKIISQHPLGGEGYTCILSPDQ